MTDSFTAYCEANEHDISAFDLDARILKNIDINDEHIILNEDLCTFENADSFDYAWHRFLQEISISSPKIFDFIVALSSCNIMKQAIFYNGDGRDSFCGLNVYLDSPMIFALLGMDSPARIESCGLLVKEMLEAGCIVQVFDHNLQEVNGILIGAGGWATSVDYRINKANNAARYFHDNKMNSQAIAEFCESVEDKLNQLGITIKKKEYDVSENSFQENEQQLYKMIEEKYNEQGQLISAERKSSILVDVRSIIMVYRERKSQTATRIQNSKQIMITLNCAIANVSKKYESNQSINAGHIPACVSSDLFGAVLWLFKPALNMEYQRKQLLADCYSSLRPTKKMLENYVESIEHARSAGETDDKQFLFMRSHSVVSDALMNVTKGDYARFNDRTYLEVYDEIISRADKKFVEEVKAHSQTKFEFVELKQELERLNALREKEKQEDAKELQELKTTVQELSNVIDKKETLAFKNRVSRWAWLLTFAIFGIPYLVIIVAAELIKMGIDDITVLNIIEVCALVVITIIAGFLFKVGKRWCFSFVEMKLTRKEPSNH